MSKPLALFRALVIPALLSASSACARAEPSADTRAAPQPPLSTRVLGAPLAGAPRADSSAPAPVSARPPEGSAVHAALPASRYVAGGVHSPLSPAVVDRLRQLRRDYPSLRDDRFLKIGDSITASHNFLHCVRRAPLALGEHSRLAAVIERFGGPRPAGDDPFVRESRAAGIGWSARAVTADAFRALEREQREVGARFALLEFGTNDAEDRAPLVFADQMRDIVDWLLARGVVPVLFTPPPRRGAAAALWAARYATIVRALAQARQVPLVDYHQALIELPRLGLAKDGVHPSTFQGPRGRDACAFTAAGLEYGYNLRNLLALQALGRLLDVVVDGGAAPDREPPVLEGDGSSTAPWLVSHLPFVDAAPYSGPGAPPVEWHPRVTKGVSGCADVGLLRGALHYRFILSERAHVYAFEFDRGNEADLVLLDAAGGCAHSPHAIERELGSGSHELLLVPRGSAGSLAGSALVLGAEPASAAALLARTRLASAQRLH